jgi:YHYH protein
MVLTINKYIVPLRLTSFIALLILSLSTVADQKWDKLGYNTGKGAVDNRSMSQPGRNTIYSCQFSALGGALNRPWVDSKGTIYFLKKPFVKGNKKWNSNIKFDDGNPNIAITGNGLPNHSTGDFPIQSGSTAYQYDRNPNSISSQRISYAIPSNPKIASKPTCLPMGAIGIALSGGVFFNALDADKRDAVANEIFDACEGHPQQQGQYHYHHNSPCFDQGKEGEHSPLLGYALDGFGLYGARGENGNVLTNNDLDKCHGHTSNALDRLGNSVNGYHYHINNEFPYTLGCFKGEVDTSMLERRPAPQGDMRGGQRDQRQEQQRGGNSNRRGGPPDLSGVAKKLGVSENKLQQALGPPPPNFKSAAKKLGISERELHEAMRAAGAP